MSPGDVKDWLDAATAGAALLVILVGGLWAYTRYVVERGILPAVQPAIDCRLLGSQDGNKLLEILLHLKNVSGSTLVAKDMSIRVLYLRAEDPIRVGTDLAKELFGRVVFPASLAKGLSGERMSSVPILKYDTFVQPGVDQVYTVVSAVPEDATFVLVKGQFTYAQRPTRAQSLAVALSRRVGLIQYTLGHVSQPHSIERAFPV